MNVSKNFNLNDKQKEQWTEFWTNSKHAHAQQHEQYAKVEQETGRTPIFISGEINGSLKCIGLFTIRSIIGNRGFSFEAICRRGPVVDNIEYFEEYLLQVISYFKSLHVGSIRIAPYWPYPEGENIEKLIKDIGFIPYNIYPNIINILRRRRLYSGRLTGLVDLQRSEDDIFESFSKSTRREIRRAERQNVVVRPVENFSEAIMFYDDLNKMCHERGLTCPDIKEFKGTYDHIFKEQKLGVLLHAYADDTFLGGLWILRGPDTAHTYWYVVSRKPLAGLSNLRIGPLLWLKGMLWAKDIGCRFLDMEGSPEDVDESNSEHRVHKFKKSFNPLTTAIFSQHSCVCNPLMNYAYDGVKLWTQGIRILKKKIHG